MESKDSIDRLFFELASESRLGILRQLLAKELKMQELARNLNLTDTETCRQLQRLTEARLIQKKPNGTYAVTSYGLLQIQLMASMTFVFKNTDFFLEHDFSRLPYQFVSRLGELSAGDFVGDIMSDFNRARKIALEASERLWVLAEQVDSSQIELTEEKVSKGLEFKFIMHQSLAKSLGNVQSNTLKGSKYLKEMGVSLLISEREASVVFRRHNGEMDYIGFFGKDERFLKWCQDLFLYYWERAQSWYPNIQIE